MSTVPRHLVVGVLIFSFSLAGAPNQHFYIYGPRKKEKGKEKKKKQA